MEKNDQISLPLLSRMSENPVPERKPPNLQSRLTSPPLGKRRRESSNESSERWRSTERENTPVSKRRRTSPTNWASGSAHQTRRRGKRLIRTLQKSTPSLLSRMKSDPTPEPPPSLLARLTLLDSDPMRRGSGTKSRNSWIRYPEKLSMETLMDTNSDLSQYGRELERRTCLGSTPPSTLAGELAALKPVEPCLNSVKTFRELDPSYVLPTASPRESPQLNGTESYEENLLISTRSSPPCTLSNLMKRERDAWEQLRLYLLWQNPNARSRRVPNGRQPSDELSRTVFSRTFSIVLRPSRDIPACSRPLSVYS